MVNLHIQEGTLAVAVAVARVPKPSFLVARCGKVAFVPSVLRVLTRADRCWQVASTSVPSVLLVVEAIAAVTEDFRACQEAVPWGRWLLRCVLAGCTMHVL